MGLVSSYYKPTPFSFVYFFISAICFIRKFYGVYLQLFIK